MVFVFLWPLSIEYIQFPQPFIHVPNYVAIMINELRSYHFETAKL